LKGIRFLVPFSLVILLAAAIPLGGCNKSQAPGSTLAQKLSSTLIPSIDLDFYIYFQQPNLTKVPNIFIQGPDNLDILVESLAIWGMSGDKGPFTVGGALNFPSNEDASKVIVEYL
jgi:hypothetical protein